MKNRLYYVFSIVFVFVFLLIVSSCSKDTNLYENYATVIYHLEGGTYAGSKEDVKIYYNVKEGEELSIGKTLDNIDNRTIEADGMGKKLAGWYKTKNEDGSYQDLITSNEKIGYKEEINLYAKWKNSTKYSFVVKAKINDTDVTLASYDAEEGEAFKVDGARKNIIKEALLSQNCTYFNSFTYDNKEVLEANASSIVMPEADSDKDTYECIIYANYIPGKFQLVSTAKELNNAIETGFETYDGIYLLNDIETNDTLNLYKFTGVSGKTIEFNGNNHTITYTSSTRNISKTTNYDYEGRKDLVLGSLFDTLDNVKIVNLNINFKLTINIANSILAGFATSVTNSTIENVNVSLAYKVSNKYAETMISVSDDLTNYNGIFDNSSTSNTLNNYKFSITKE